MLVLLPKSNADTQGIGLLEVLWKAVEAIINTHIKTEVMFHEVLHRFFSCRGMGRDIMELKMTQEIESINRESSLLVFLDLRKAYNTLDRGPLLQTLEGYGAGPKTRGILEEFLLRQEVVTKNKWLP